MLEKARISRKENGTVVETRHGSIESERSLESLEQHQMQLLMQAQRITQIQPHSLVEHYLSS